MTANIWITGASSGIGAETALQYAKLGANVAVSARNKDNLEHVASSKKSSAGSIKAFPCDVTDQPQMHTAFKHITYDLQNLDIVIFNAGKYMPTPAEEAFSSAPYIESITVNYLSIIHGLELVIPHMIKNGGGKIAIVASLAGLNGLPNAAAYGASKAALINLCETLKVDLQRHGIAIHLINPGFVRTPMTAVNEFPMPFLMEPEDAARKIIAGIEKNKFLITFPFIFSSMLRILRLLPYRIYFILVKLLTKS